MKAVKIKKRYYKDLPFMYKDLGLIDKANSCDPSRVLCSKNDYKLFEKATKDIFMKQHPYTTSKKIEFGVAMHLLNLGPSERVCQAIKDGYLLILDSKVDND